MNKTEIARWIFIVMFLIGSGEMFRGIYSDAQYQKKHPFERGMSEEEQVVSDEIQASLDMLEREGLIKIPSETNDNIIFPLND